MANHAYLRVWTRDFSIETMIAEFARFLTTAPLSASHHTFEELIVQAVDPGETPIAEWDLRPLDAGPAEVAAMAALHLNSDTAYIVSARWDLWGFDIESLKWQRKPEPLILTCHGLDYDDGVAATAGHFQADLGFEHFFTGHAGMLPPAAASNPFNSSEHPEQQLEAISRQDPREHPTIVSLAGGHRTRAARGTDRALVRRRGEHGSPAGCDSHTALGRSFRGQPESRSPSTERGQQLEL